MRIVRFDAATGLALSKYLRARGKHRHTASPMLWVGTDGALNPDAFNCMFKRRSTKAGVKVHPHMYRHDFSHRYLGAVHACPPITG
jgi:site-specific recombinase XerD